MKRLPLSVLLLSLAIMPLAGAENTGKTPVDFAFDAKTIDRSGASGRVTSYADVLDKVTPAVVSIQTSQLVRYTRMSRNRMDELLRQMWGIPSPDDEDGETPAQGRRTERKLPLGLGSGTLVSADGYILTNRHVISKQDGTQADEITVTLQDKREFTAKVIGADPQTDIALIKIEGKALPFARMTNSNALRVGDIVFAVGNPLGVGMTVTSGIVSAVGRNSLGILGGRGGIENFIQTDASINPGNSGGPLIDADGRIVGVNTAIISGTRTNIGLGFAVPTAIARDVIVAFANDGKIARGYFGITAQDIDRQTAEALKLDTQEGALVSRVSADSPAGKAGVHDGDIITAVNTQTVDSWATLRTIIAQLKPGDRAKIALLRDGKTKELTVTAGDRDTADRMVSNETPLTGVTLGTVTAEARRQFAIPDDVNGMLVTAVDPSSPLAEKLAPGVVVTSLNRKPIADVKDFVARFAKGRANSLQLFYRGTYSILFVRTAQ